MPAQLQRRLLIFAVLLTLVVGSLFAHWLLIGRFIESTDNAYVQGEITRVSSQLSARVAKVLVGDNQHVQKGDLLLELEADDFRLALDRARAYAALFPDVEGYRLDSGWYGIALGPQDQANAAIRFEQRQALRAVIDIEHLDLPGKQQGSNAQAKLGDPHHQRQPQGHGSIGPIALRSRAAISASSPPLPVLLAFLNGLPKPIA